MEKKLIFLEKFYEMRYRAGKVHLYHSINKNILRLGNSVKLEKVFISKDYLSYLSEKMFSNKYRLLEFFAGNNSYVRLSLADEFTKDYGRDIVKEIQEDFMELKQYNSLIFKDVRKALERIMESPDKKIEEEDFVLFENYLANWKRLENKIRNFIPEEYYGRKNDYFYTSLLSFIKFFEKYKDNYNASINFIESK